MTVAEKIERKINRMAEGTTFKYQHLDITANEYSAATKAIERLIARGIIKRVSTGIFYKPQKTLFGDLRPREEELLKPYLFYDNRRIAYITGISLYNRMGITTQIPKFIKIASRSKRITVSAVSLKAKPVKSYVDVTNDNYYLLEILDVLKDFGKIPDLDKKMAIKQLKSRLDNMSSRELRKIIKYALEYPPRTRAFLGALLDEVCDKQYSLILKQSLNPLTTFNLGINNEILKTSLNWNIE